MAKLLDKLFNRVIKGKLTIEKGDDVRELFPENIKEGSYVYDADSSSFKHTDSIPEDFSGLVIQFADDGLYILGYNNGELVNDTSIYPGGMEMSDGDEFVNYNAYGATKLNFAQLTHSLVELDETLRGIIEDAIADGANDGVACTQAQWNTIKSLLDKSLYLNYTNMSLIKSFTNGIDTYGFGAINAVAGSIGYMLEIQYISENSLLYARYSEI